MRGSSATDVLARRVTAFFVVATTLVALIAPPGAQAATALYPDLRTLPPRDLELARVDVGGGDSSASGTHNVLRFSNTVWNAGEGDLEVRGVPGPQSSQTPGPAYQRIFDDTGAFTERDAGKVAWHEAHGHYHYDGWGLFQLWTAADYDAWVAQGKPPSTIATTGSKTTSCILDEEFIGTPAATRWPQQYRFSGCLANSQGQLLEGLAVGWGDTYDSWRYDQWIDLGPTRTLAPGEYVLRSVVDPGNKIWESAGGTNSDREATTANDAIQRFTIGSGGTLVDEDTPTGTVSLDDVAKATSDTTVDLKVLGRDDVGGVKEFRVSNDGQTWTAPIAYTGVDSTPHSMQWNVADPQFGGDSSAGQKTVRVQFRDHAHSAWGQTETDSIQLVAPGPGTPYSESVRADGPLGYWRLDEANATFGALDEVGGNNGQYVGSPAVGAPGLLGAEPDHRAVAFDGNDAIRYSDSSALDRTTSMTLEAWIKPTAFPAAGRWASVMSKADSYSLQFIGDQLEFTIMTNPAGHPDRGRERLRLASGAIPLGQITHVAATYDGATQRLYMNGNQVLSRATTAPAQVTGNALYLGSWDGGSEFLTGTIDEAAIYGAVLNQSRIRAHYDAGKSPASPPAAPASLLATDMSSSRIDLTWLHPSSDESSFVLQRSTDAGFTNPVAINISENRESYSDTGLEPNRQYWYRILARGPAGSSDWSNVATDTTRAAAPVVATSAATAIGDSAATLNGTVDPRGSATSYWFEYRPTASSGGFASTSQTGAGSGRSPAAASADVTGLQPATAYTYRVVAQSAGGTARGADATLTTDAQPPPAAPGGFAATAVSPAEIDLTWTDASSDETSFDIERSVSPNFESPTSLTANANATSFNDGSLEPSQTYYYRLRSRGGTSTSAWVTASAATQAAPPPPHNSPGAIIGSPFDGTETSPGPPPLPNPSPPRDQTPPLAWLSIPDQTLERVLRRGLVLRLKSSEPGMAAAHVLATPSALGVRGTRAELALGRVTKRIGRAGTTTVVVKLSATARRLLAPRRSVRLQVETTVTDAAGNRSRTIRIPLVVSANRAARR